MKCLIFVPFQGTQTLDTSDSGSDSEPSPQKTSVHYEDFHFEDNGKTLKFITEVNSYLCWFCQEPQTRLMSHLVTNSKSKCKDKVSDTEGLKKNFEVFRNRKKKITFKTRYPEMNRAYQKKYRKNHPEEEAFSKNLRQQYYEIAHVERVLEYNRKHQQTYKTKHKEKAAENQKKYQKNYKTKHPEKAAENQTKYQKTYKTKHPEKAAENQTKYQKTYKTKLKQEAAETSKRTAKKRKREIKREQRENRKGWRRTKEETLIRNHKKYNIPDLREFLGLPKSERLEGYQAIQEKLLTEDVTRMPTDNWDTKFR